jgi:exodeoxyribonuclease VII large subunit
MPTYYPVLEEETRFLTVSDLNARIKDLVEANYNFIWVWGEISNLRIPSSGHAYFTLKDHQSQIKAVIFRTQFHRLRFIPEDGLQVLCNGRISVYEPRGEYQLVVELMEPQGMGALQLAFEQLKKKLDREGLFEPARKKPLPPYPQHIAIVTSPTGAAIRDILKTLQRSPCPLCITVIPVRVQGQEAAAEIAEAIHRANRMAGDFGWDVLIVARGGGSIEDLWSFNEEIVARAIAASQIPTFSAVGHEIDFTISDMAADARMPTPTAAAEWIVSRMEDAHRQLCGYGERLSRVMNFILESQRERVHYLRKRLVDPGRLLTDLRMLTDDRAERLHKALLRYLERLRTQHSNMVDRLSPLLINREIDRSREHLDKLEYKLSFCNQTTLSRNRLQLRELISRLEALSPLSVLARGYSIGYKLPQHAVIRRWTDVKAGDKVRIQLFEGRLECIVTRTEKSPSTI